MTCCYTDVKSAEDEARINKKRSKKAQRKYEKRKKTAKVEPALEEQFVSGRLLGMRICCILLSE